MEIISQTEAAKRLGMSIPTFRKLMLRAKIKPLKRGTYIWEVITRRVQEFSQQG